MSRTQGSESVVSIAHAPDKDVSDDEVLDLTRRAVDALGGIRRFVRPGDMVVIKPNQTLWFLATDGVTTDPRVVASLVTLCKRAGASHITVGDSSGGDLRTKRVLEVTGIKRYAEQAGADEVVGFEDVEQEELDIEVDGQRMTMRVPKPLLDAQCVINAPKAKTHFEDLISCCLKNWVGILAQKQRPQFMQDPLLYKVTAWAHKRVPAKLHVVDGLWAGEGDGPAANDATWLGCIVAGQDPVATDATVARLMGLHPSGLRFAQHAEELGIGTRDPRHIRVAGMNVEQAAIRARPTRPGYDHLPVRVLHGEGVTWAGSLGHFKSIGDVFLKYHMWGPIEAAYGKPTFMIGRVDDPDFERHVEEGPYFVIDDAAHEKYKRDPRVTFIPGHPATHNIFPHIFDRLHVDDVGPLGLKLAGVFKQVESWFHQPGWDARRAPRREEEPRR